MVLAAADARRLVAEHRERTIRSFETGLDELVSVVEARIEDAARRGARCTTVRVADLFRPEHREFPDEIRRAVDEVQAVLWDAGYAVLDAGRVCWRSPLAPDERWRFTVSWDAWSEAYRRQLREGTARPSTAP